VAVLIYATSSDLANWTQQAAPANAATLLRSASLLVRDATKVCYYAVDSNNLPTDATILQAFKDATCCQAAFWAANGIDPTAPLAQPGVLNQKAIGSARLGYDTAGAGSLAAWQAKVQAAAELCDEAVRILQDANLRLTGAWVIG
jgi:hypothetical protein